MSTQNLDYFRKDVKFTGIHSRYIGDLWEQNVIKTTYINRLYELFGLATIIGLRLKKTSPVDSTEGVKNLQAAQMYNYEPVLKTIMKTVLLLDETMGLSEEERIRRAFRGPETQEELDENMRLFESYARAGIEFLHEELVERPSLFDDSLTDHRLANIMALLNKEM